MARTVFVVATRDALWPPEVWVVFGIRAAAEEHVRRAAWEFRVEPLPVYAGYEDCPPGARGLDSSGGELMDRAMRRLCRSGVIGSVPDDSSTEPDDPAELPPWGPRPGTVYAVCSHDSDRDIYVEVQLFYETQTAADEHVERSYCMSIVLPFPVYGTYDGCPAARRFTNARDRRRWSQSMRSKHGDENR